MRRLNYIKFDENGEYATVGWGTLTGEFTNPTHAQSREVTVGSCPCTGVMGIGLGAGIGMKTPYILFIRALGIITNSSARPAARHVWVLHGQYCSAHTCALRWDNQDDIRNREHRSLVGC
jgi:hypothetical protein